MRIRNVKNKATQFMLFLLVCSFGFSILVAGAIGLIVGFSEALSLEISFNAIITSPWILMATQLGGLLLPLLLWIGLNREKFKATMPNSKLSGKALVIIIALSFLSQPAMMLISYVSSLFFPNVADELITAMSAQPFILMLIAIAVIPGIVEELVFRGYIQSHSSNTTVLKMALLNGLLFGMIHMNFQQFSYAFVMGILLAYLVYYTKSIWAGIIPHFIINATQITLGRLAQGAEESLAIYYEGVPEINEATTFVILFIIAIIASVICAVLIRVLINDKKEQFENEEPESIGENVEKKTDTLKLFVIEQVPDGANISGERKIIAIDWCFWISVVLFLIMALLLV